MSKRRLDEDYNPQIEIKEKSSKKNPRNNKQTPFFLEIKKKFGAFKKRDSNQQTLQSHCVWTKDCQPLL